jgi:hypothetical protein
LHSAVRISELDTSEAILIALKVSERMVEPRRADPPRLLKIVLGALHDVRSDGKPALVGLQDGSPRDTQHQVIDMFGPKRQVRMGTTPVGTWVRAQVRGRCPHLETVVR